MRGSTVIWVGLPPSILHKPLPSLSEHPTAAVSASPLCVSPLAPQTESPPPEMGEMEEEEGVVVKGVKVILNHYSDLEVFLIGLVGRGLAEESLKPLQ